MAMAVGAAGVQQAMVMGQENIVTCTLLIVPVMKGLQTIQSKFHQQGDQIIPVEDAGMGQDGNTIHGMNQLNGLLS
jgi:hypothetical protein